MRNAGKRRVGIFIGCVAALFVAVIVAQAHVERKYRASASLHINLVVDSIDYRTDLTRLYGKLIGVPHTSQRIDALTLSSASKTYQAVDIDGVDFKRWFQWEDDGIIAVEIDFDVMSPVKHGVITINTPRGVDTMRIDRP